MAIPAPPARTCVLTVGIKCCKGCQTTAKRKLLSVPGVSTVEYNAEQGFLIVSGDVNPTTLVHKLAKWGKHAELVSVKNQPEDSNSHGDSSSPSQSPIPIASEHNQGKTKEKQGLIKGFLLSCFGKRTSKTKVEPLAMLHAPVRETHNSQYRGAEFGNDRAMPFIKAAPPQPPVLYPPPQAMHGFSPSPSPSPSPIPYPPPYFGTGQPPLPLPPPHNAGMFRASPPPSTPYFQSRQMRATPLTSTPYFQSRQTQFPQMVSHRQHYPGH